MVAEWATAAEDPDLPLVPSQHNKLQRLPRQGFY